MHTVVRVPIMRTCIINNTGGDDSFLIIIIIFQSRFQESRYKSIVFIVCLPPPPAGSEITQRRANGCCRYDSYERVQSKNYRTHTERQKFVSWIGYYALECIRKYYFLDVTLEMVFINGERVELKLLHAYKRRLGNRRLR